MGEHCGDRGDPRVAAVSSARSSARGEPRDGDVVCAVLLPCVAKNPVCSGGRTLGPLLIMEGRLLLLGDSGELGAGR